MPDDSQANVPAQERGTSSPAVAAAVKPVSSWVLPIVTALVLISAFCLYYFVYVPARHEYLVNRNFRSLAVLGDQVQSMVSIHSSILEYSAHIAENKHGDREGQELKQFAVVRPEDVSKKPAERDEEALRDYLRYLAPGFALKETPVERSKRLPRLEVQRRNGRWELVLSAHHHDKYQKDYVGSLELSRMLEPLVRSLPFDDIVLVSKNGTIVYQSNTAGPQFTTLTGLLQAQPETSETKSTGNKEQDKAEVTSQDDAQETEDHVLNRNADKTWRTRSMHLTDVVLAGSHYKLFLQPVLVDAFMDEDEAHQDEPAQEWVLCGLRSAKALEWEALSISSTFMVWLTALFVAVFMSGPLLKILFMNHRQHLRLREVGFLGIILVLLTSVLTFAGFNFLSRDDTDEQLQRIADRLSSNIHDELQHMRQQLQDLCQTDALWTDLQSVTQDHKVIRKVDDPKLPLSSMSSYPYFHNVFWTDDDGTQIVKWGTSQYLTPMIDVSQTRLFRHAKTAYLDGTGPTFYFDSVMPPNKVEYLAALTMRTADCDPRLQTSGISKDLWGGSAFLTTQPLSLIDPILPYGYGFALLDEDGRVLFHTDKTRNLHENFMQETDWSKQLHAAMFGHSNQRPLRLKYLGGDYMVRVMPISGISQAPWSLVVYRDLTAVKTLNFQAITIASTLFLLIFGLPATAIAFWYLIRRPRFAPEWLWPNPARIITYVYEIIFLAVLITLFLFLGFTGTSEQNVIACAIVPYTAFLLTALCIRAYAPGKEKAPARGARRSYSWLILSAILGAIAFILIWWRPYLPAVTDLTLFAAIAAVPLLDPMRRYLLIKSKRFFRRGTGTEHQRQGRADINLYICRGGYIVSALMFLLLVGILVPMALFHASRNIEHRLSIKQAQLYLASALDQRLISIQEMCAKDQLGQYACSELKKASTSPCVEGGAPANERTSGAQETNPWRQIVLDPMFPDDGTLPVACGHSSEERLEERYRGWFKDLIYELHHDYNLVSSETLGIISDRINFQSGRNKNSDSGNARLEPVKIDSNSDAERGKPADNVAEWFWEDEKFNLTLRWHGIHLLSKPSESDGPAAPLAAASKRQRETAPSPRLVSVKKRGAPKQDPKQDLKQAPEQVPESDLLITATVPSSLAADAYTGLGIAIAVVTAIGFIVWTLARRIFLFQIVPLKMTGEMRVAELIREGRNVAVLLPLFSDWTLEAPKWTLNLREVAKAPGWVERLDLDKLPVRIPIEIAHFEHIVDDPELEKEKFILLQRLSARENIQVVVMMTAAPSSEDYGRIFRDMEVVDLRDEPFYWLKQYQGPARDLIWEECGPMAALWPLGAQLANDLKSERVNSQETIVSEILERADGYYRLVWNEASNEQKFVLSQLADDGLLNPTNGRAIRQLVRKGLIKPVPQFRLMNESFRRFVCSATSADLKQGWLRESRRSGWGKIHGAFFTTMILFGVFLLTTQNALWQSAAAYVTTALGALGTVVKLFNTYRGGGTTEKAG